MAEFDEITEPYRRSRDAVKQRVSFCLDQMEVGIRSKTLTKSCYVRQTENINALMDNIAVDNKVIDDLCVRINIPLDDDQVLNNHREEAVYTLNVHHQLGIYDDYFNPVVLNSGRLFKLNIDTPKYSALSTDPLVFKNFYHQFRACVDADPTLPDSMKLTLLKSCIQDTQLLQHLSNDGGNYAKALRLIEAEFLDKGELMTACLGKIMNSNPTYDPELEGHKTYLMEVRAAIEELRVSHGMDVINENSGRIMVGYVVFNKLPTQLKKALIEKTGSNYPSIKDILDHHFELIKMLRMTKYTPREKFSKGSKSGTAPAALQNFATNTSQVTQKSEFSCGFCGARGHSALVCSRYNTHQIRLDRCGAAGLCTLCTSSNHNQSKCPGKDSKLRYPCKICKGKCHISAMCPKFIPRGHKDDGGSKTICHMGMLAQPHILPVVSL